MKNFSMFVTLLLVAFTLNGCGASPVSTSPTQQHGSEVNGVVQTGAPNQNGGALACTMEAKMCPDGSSVGRSGPNCEFKTCPGETLSNPPKTSAKLPASANYDANLIVTQYLEDHINDYAPTAAAKGETWEAHEVTLNNNGTATVKYSSGVAQKTVNLEYQIVDGKVTVRNVKEISS